MYILSTPRAEYEKVTFDSSPLNLVSLMPRLVLNKTGMLPEKLRCE